MSRGGSTLEHTGTNGERCAVLPLRGHSSKLPSTTGHVQPQSVRHDLRAPAFDHFLPRAVQGICRWRQGLTAASDTSLTGQVRQFATGCEQAAWSTEDRPASDACRPDADSRLAPLRPFTTGRGPVRCQRLHGGEARQLRRRKQSRRTDRLRGGVRVLRI